MSQYTQGIPEEQQIEGAGYKTVMLTSNNTPTPMKTIQVQNGETGSIFVRYNAIAAGRSAKRWKVIDFEKTLAGVLTINNVQSIYSRNGTGLNSVDFTATAVNGNIEIKVTGIAENVLHVMQTEVTSGILD